MRSLAPGVGEAIPKEKGSRLEGLVARAVSSALRLAPPPRPPADPPGDQGENPVEAGPHTGTYLPLAPGPNLAGRQRRDSLREIGPARVEHSRPSSACRGYRAAVRATRRGEIREASRVPPSAPSGAVCDLRSCGRPAVRIVDNCRVCEQHVDLAFAARVPPARSVLRYFPWLWKLTPELVNAFHDQAGEAWKEAHGDA